MQWRKIWLANSQVASGEHARIQDEFERAFISLGGPTDMAVFDSREVTETGMCLYFTPEAVERAGDLLDRLGAEECDRPTEELALLVGHADALTRFQSGEL